MKIITYVMSQKKKWNNNTRFGSGSKNKCCCHRINFHQNYEVVHFNVKREDVLLKKKC